MNPDAKTVLLVMDGIDERTVAQLRCTITPSFLIVTDAKGVPGVANAFLVNCVFVAGYASAEANALTLAALPRDVPIERVFSRSADVLAERMRHVLAR